MRAPSLFDVVRDVLIRVRAGYLFVTVAESPVQMRFREWSAVWFVLAREFDDPRVTIRVRSGYRALRGLPPFLPFSLAASALASLVACPPFRPRATAAGFLRGIFAILSGADELASRASVHNIRSTNLDESAAPTLHVEHEINSIRLVSGEALQRRSAVRAVHDGSLWETNAATGANAVGIGEHDSSVLDRGRRSATVSVADTLSGIEKAFRRVTRSGADAMQFARVFVHSVLLQQAAKLGQQLAVTVDHIRCVFVAGLNHDDRALYHVAKLEFLRERSLTLRRVLRVLEFIGRVDARWANCAVVPMFIKRCNEGSFAAILHNDHARVGLGLIVRVQKSNNVAALERRNLDTLGHLQGVGELIPNLVAIKNFTHGRLLAATDSERTPVDVDGPFAVRGSNLKDPSAPIHDVDVSRMLDRRLQSVFLGFLDKVAHLDMCHTEDYKPKRLGFVNYVESGRNLGVFGGACVA